MMILTSVLLFSLLLLLLLLDLLFFTTGSEVLLSPPATFTGEFERTLNTGECLHKQELWSWTVLYLHRQTVSTKLHLHRCVLHIALELFNNVVPFHEHWKVFYLSLFTFPYSRPLSITHHDGWFCNYIHCDIFGWCEDIWKAKSDNKNRIITPYYCSYSNQIRIGKQ